MNIFPSLKRVKSMQRINKYEQKRELTPEEKFELMIAKWKKDSDERLKDIKKSKNRWIDNERYTLSPFRKLK